MPLKGAAFILVYTLVLGDGRVLTHKKDARFSNNFKPLKTIHNCRAIADAQQERLRLGIKNTSIKDVKVVCIKSKK